MKKQFLLFALCALAGCAQAGGKTLGKAPDSTTITVVKELKTGSRATISGVMYEKCPVAGCWFMLRDKTGVIRVDTKAAGFNVLDLPVNTTVTVSGEVTSP